jgi:hypothetical protein
MIALLIARKITGPAAHYAQRLTWIPGVARHLARHPLHAFLLLGCGWAPVLFLAYPLELLRLQGALRWWLTHTGYLEMVVDQLGYDPESFDV